MHVLQEGKLKSRCQPGIKHFLQPPTSSGNSSSTKRRTTGSVGKTKTWSKDVVCLPGCGDEELNGATPAFFSIPRGQARAKLTEDGLVGKIRIVSTWTPRQVRYTLLKIKV